MRRGRALVLSAVSAAALLGARARGGDFTERYNERFRIAPLNALPDEAPHARLEQFSGWQEAVSPTYTFTCGDTTVDGRPIALRYRFAWRHSGAYAPPGAARPRGRYLADLRLQMSGEVLLFTDMLDVALDADRVDGGDAEDPVPVLRAVLSFRCRDRRGRWVSLYQYPYLFTGDGRFQPLLAIEKTLL